MTNDDSGMNLVSFVDKGVAQPGVAQPLISFESMKKNSAELDLSINGSVLNLSKVNRFIEDSRLENIKLTLNSRTGTTSVTGDRDGLHYACTIQCNRYGEVRTESQYTTNLGKDIMIEQIKELRKQGHKQVDIANMLGVSQPLVSRYLKR